MPPSASLSRKVLSRLTHLSIIASWPTWKRSAPSEHRPKNSGLTCSFFTGDMTTFYQTPAQQKSQEMATIKMVLLWLSMRRVWEVRIPTYHYKQLWLLCRVRTYWLLIYEYIFSLCIATTRTCTELRTTIDYTSFACKRINHGTHRHPWFPQQCLCITNCSLAHIYFLFCRTVWKMRLIDWLYTSKAVAHLKEKEADKFITYFGWCFCVVPLIHAHNSCLLLLLFYSFLLCATRWSCQNVYRNNINGRNDSSVYHPLRTFPHNQILK